MTATSARLAEGLSAPTATGSAAGGGGTTGASCRLVGRVGGAGMVPVVAGCTFGAPANDGGPKSPTSRPDARGELEEAGRAEVAQGAQPDDLVAADRVEDVVHRAAARPDVVRICH